jgi:Ca2+-binding RTX toxin-like protein
MALTAYARASWSYPNVTNFRGRFLASDPTIVGDDGIFRMFYTEGFDDGTTIRPVIAEAVSADGWTWTPVGGTAATGMVVSGDGGDRANLEGASVFMAGDTYVLLYSTYADDGDPIPQFPASLYAAVSTDGIHFTPVSGGPVLAPTTGWYDNDAVYSPTVLAYQGGYLMLYCGHAYTDASGANGDFGVSLLAAFSSDGLNWTKSPSPVLRADPALAWMSDGVAEPSMILGPDGNYYLFFTGLAGAERAIGIAVAADPLGPWEVAPQPIITAQSAGLAAGGTVIAPHAELVNGVLRLWYTEVTPDDTHSIAYAESDWGAVSLPGVGQTPHWLGTSLDDVIAGTDGADRITAEGGDDLVAGGSGGDVIDVGEGLDEVWADAGNDSVLGGSGDDLIHMGAGADTADGDDGSDVLAGEAGADVLRGGLGADTLDGGSEADTLDGGSGNDVLYAGGGNDRAFGGSENDQVFMGAGADTADGDDGNDILAGEAGADLLRAGLGEDTLDGGAEADTLDGGADNDVLYGGDNNDLVLGGAGVDLLVGEDGDDTLDGGLDADTLSGGIGNDSYIVDHPGDLVLEELNGGLDTVWTNVNFTLGDNLENLAIATGVGAGLVLTGNALGNLITGGAGQDSIGGGDGMDRLQGGAGNDVLTGGAGQDILAGGAGNDQLQGNAGRDAFLFDTVLNATSNLDRLIGFAPVDDTIQLENAIFTGLGLVTGGLAAAAFRSAAGATSAGDATDRIIYDSRAGNLYYDTDGAGGMAAIRFAVVENKPAITAADFLII